MASLLKLPRECRSPETEVLPDSRRRLTRFFDLGSVREIPDELDFAPGALDQFPQDELEPPWQNLRLTYKKLTDDVPPAGRDSRPILQLIFETINLPGETPVGGTDITHLDDGRVALVLNYLQFTSDTYNPQTVGTSVSPADTNAFLMTEEAPDDGTLRRIKRTYVYAGTIATDDKILKNGTLLLKTITSVHTVPATPAGFTLIGAPVQHPLGLPIYTYSYAMGSGVNLLDIEYRLSSDQGTNGMTVETWRAFSDSSVSSNPISTPAGFVLVNVKYEDDDGFRIWTAIYAKGAGTVISSVTYQMKGKLVIYAKTALSAAPSAPSPTIGGTVNLIESSQRYDRFHEGVQIFEYRWAEGNGQVEINVRGREDGSLVYTVTELENAITTPSYPGTGTADLVDLANRAEEGFYRNIATYIKRPPDIHLKQFMEFSLPGIASFTGSPPALLMQPPNDHMRLLVDVEVSYDTSQITDTPWTVGNYASLQEVYIPYANPGPSPTPGSPPADPTTSPPVERTTALGNYLAGASGISDTDNFYNGVFCQFYQAVLVSSTPDVWPSGATVLHTDNEIYHTATDGTVVYRRRKTTYSF